MIMNTQHTQLTGQYDEGSSWGVLISLHAFTSHCLSCSRREFIGYCCWDPQRGPASKTNVLPRSSTTPNHNEENKTLFGPRIILCVSCRMGFPSLVASFCPVADAPGFCLTVFLPKILYLLLKSSSSVLFIETL